MTRLPPAEGQMSGTDLDVLRELSRGKCVLEIGTWRGRSALEMAYEAEEVWCLDTFCGDPSMEAIYGPQFTLPDFAANARERGLWDKIRILVGRWQDTLLQINLARFDLAFYDADHSFDSTLGAGKILCQCLRPEAVVAFHDFGNPTRDAVAAAVEHLARDHGRRLERRGDIIGVLLPAIGERPA